MNKTLVCLILAAAVMAPLGYADLLSNPINGGTITVDTNRLDWSGLSSYTQDDDDAPTGEVDWRTFTMAHDGTSLYIRYTTWDGPGYTNASRYNIFIDRDQDRDTGFYGGGAELSIGAELLLQGIYLYSWAGTTNQGEWAWSSIGQASWNELTNDYELAFSIAWLGMTNRTLFNWVAMADQATRDYVPDDGGGGSTGGYHTYAIPEPGSVVLLSIGVLSALALRRRSAKV